MSVRKVFVSVGSNIEKEKNIISGVQSLQKTFNVLQISPVYESRAVGFEGDNFYNMVITFNTNYQPRQVKNILCEIEKQHHRVHQKNKFSSRTLDLDQILHGNLIIDEPDLQIPSKEISQYAFILYPLTDIADKLIHPTLGKPLAELRKNCQDHDTLLRKLAFSEIKLPA